MALGLGSEPSRQDLDRELPLQARIGAEVHLAHPTAAKHR
jgi:hypothetical protein